MELLTLEGTYFSQNLDKNRDITKLKQKFDELYNRALILKDKPNTSEYKKIKAELISNLQEREQLAGG